jgi:hypothetical protein
LAHFMVDSLSFLDVFAFLGCLESDCGSDGQHVF